MFPADMAPLIDVSGKRYAHTVRWGLEVVGFYLFYSFQNRNVSRSLT